MQRLTLAYKRGVTDTVILTVLERDESITRLELWGLTGKKNRESSAKSKFRNQTLETI